MAQSVMLTERYNVSYIDLKSGLPHNNVSAIFVDSNGFLWIGTYGGGLVRYDGYGMMTPVMWLKSNSCKSIAEDRFKRLWVAFDEGTNIIDLNTMMGISPESLSDSVRTMLPEPSTKAYCDALGRIWLVTFSSVNLLAFDEQGRISKVSTYRYQANTPDVCIRDVEGNGKPWIGIDGGLFRLVEKNGSLVREEISPLFRSLNGLYITDILKRSNVFWITTNHGLFRYNPYQHSLDHYVHIAIGGSLSHEFLSALALMPDNTLLVGSLSGVNVYDEQTDHFSVWNSASIQPLQSDFVHCLLVDKGLIWIGTESGGVAKLVPRQLLLQNYVHTASPTSISPNPVNAMYVEPDGTLWVGTVEGGLNRKARGQTGFVHLTKANSTLSHNSVSALVNDDKGRLWTGTWGGGLNVVDLTSGAVRRVEMTEEEARLTNFIGALAYDARNNGLWIGSNDGIFLYDLNSTRFQSPCAREKLKITYHHNAHKQRARLRKLRSRRYDTPNGVSW